MFPALGWRPIASDLESLLGIGLITVFTGALAIFSICWLLVLTTQERHHFGALEATALWIEWLVIMAIQFQSISFVVVAFSEARRPRPVNVALRQRFRWPWLGRLIGIWWAANALCMLAMGEGFLWLVDRMSPHDFSSWPYQVGVFLIFFGCSYAANTFIVLAAATYNRRRSALLAVWRFRVAVDAACAIVALGVNHFVQGRLKGFW